MEGGRWEATDGGASVKEVDEERLDLTWPDWAGVGEGQGQAVRGVNGGRRQVQVVSTEYRYEYKDPDVLRMRRSALPTVCLGWLVRSTRSACESQYFLST